MINWHLHYWKRTKHGALLLCMSALYALDLVNLLTGKNLKTSFFNAEKFNFWSLIVMFAGSLVWSWITYRRHKWDLNLRMLLRMVIGGQAIFMLLQGLGLLLQNEFIHFASRMLWAFFFVPNLGFMVALLISRLNRRERTWGLSLLSTLGCISTGFLVPLLNYVFPGDLAFWQFLMAGFGGIVFWGFFRFIPFEEPQNIPQEPELHNFWSPFNQNGFLSVQVMQAILPLVGVGIFTYYFFAVGLYWEVLGFEAAKSNAANIGIMVRYAFTGLGTFTAGWWSWQLKQRSSVIRSFMVLQLATVALLMWASKTQPTFIAINAFAGFSTGVFLLSVLTAGESFGLKKRAAIIVFLSGLFRGIGALILGGLILLNDTTVIPNAIAEIGFVVVLLGFFSSFALDDSNFEGDADLKGFDNDQYDPNAVLKITGLAQYQWSDKKGVEELLENCNTTIFEEVKRIFGSWVYHCKMYYFDKTNNKFLYSTTSEISEAWNGLKFSHTEFNHHLSFALELLEKLKMESLVRMGFDIHKRQIILHNGAKNQLCVDTGTLVYDLSKIDLNIQEDQNELYRFFTNSNIDFKSKFAKLQSLEKEANVPNFHGFGKNSIELRRVLIIRKIECIPMPKGEYNLHILYPDRSVTPTRIALVLLTASEKVTAHLGIINNLLQDIVLTRAQVELNIEKVVGLESINFGLQLSGKIQSSKVVTYCRDITGGNEIRRIDFLQTLNLIQGGLTTLEKEITVLKFLCSIRGIEMNIQENHILHEAVIPTGLILWSALPELNIKRDKLSLYLNQDTQNASIKITIKREHYNKIKEFDHYLELLSKYLTDEQRPMLEYSNGEISWKIPMIFCTILKPAHIDQDRALHVQLTEDQLDQEIEFDCQILKDEKDRTMPEYNNKDGLIFIKRKNLIAIKCSNPSTVIYINEAQFAQKSVNLKKNELYDLFKVVKPNELYISGEVWVECSRDYFINTAHAWRFFMAAEIRNRRQSTPVFNPFGNDQEILITYCQDDMLTQNYGISRIEVNKVEKNLNTIISQDENEIKRGLRRGLLVTVSGDLIPIAGEKTKGGYLQLKLDNKNKPQQLIVQVSRIETREFLKKVGI